ncbi:MAG: LytR/AlgR family response regulator transcription factor [Bacteroidota bacterium]
MENRKLNCIVIDDEPLACKGLVEYIQEVDSLNLIAVVNSPAEAIKYLPKSDLMYLDINMPKISGIDFLKQVKNPPLTIITTAYQQYALEGYELDVIDYLLKPISFQRFIKATTKAIDYFRIQNSDPVAISAVGVRDYFFVKSNGVLEKIMLSEILTVEAMANYIIINCSNKKVVAYLTLKQINEFLPEDAFLKVHKSYIVACDKINRIDHDEIIISGMTVPVGMNYKEIVEQKIINGKILKR